METLQIAIRARDDKEDELLRTCQLISDQTLQESGCESSLTSQKNTDDGLINFEQKWDLRSSLNNYFRSDHFTALLGAMKWLGQYYDIRINGGTHEEGMKIIKFERGT
jgi:quinol monooxygenase YgiN